MSTLSLSWAANQAERNLAGAFLARVIGGDTSYISHGEIQTALSLDGKSWASDLEQRFAQDMSEIGEERSVALARRGDELIGAAIVLWETNEPEALHAVLEDIAVEPAARGAGAGQALVRFIEAEAQQRGMKWMFLESGLRNQLAHRFFQASGYEPVSKVFAKRL